MKTYAGNFDVIHVPECIDSSNRLYGPNNSLGEADRLHLGRLLCRFLRVEIDAKARMRPRFGPPSRMTAVPPLQIQPRQSSLSVSEPRTPTSN